MTVNEATVWLNPEFQPQADLPAIFADRDGTLLEHVDYLGDPDQVRLLPGVRTAVRELLDAGAAFFVFTNQSGVGRGYYPLEAVFRCHARMFELMGVEMRRIAGYCIAPGAPGDGDPYRKPAPRFIDEALDRFQIPREQAHMVGDTRVDLRTAAAAGVHAWLVGNGKPEAVQAHRSGEIALDYRFRESFPACAQAILNESL